MTVLFEVWWLRLDEAFRAEAAGAGTVHKHTLAHTR